MRHTQASIQHAAARSSHATPHTTQSRLCSERMSMQLRSTGPRIVRYGEGWVRSTCDSKERAGARGHGHCLTALYCGRSMLAVAGFVAFATQCSRSCRAKCSARVEGHVVQFGYCEHQYGRFTGGDGEGGGGEDTSVAWHAAHPPHHCG